MAERVVDFAEQAVGVPPPSKAFLALDASIMDNLEDNKVVREDIKMNRIEFLFPTGLATVDIMDECRALCDAEDFDTMYDYTMSSLVDKDVIINLKNMDGSKQQLCAFHVTDKMMDLHGIDAINDYPILVNWLCEFMGAYIIKKFPVPQKSQSPQLTAREKKKRIARAFQPETPQS
jgi:hypothetical protein